MCVCVCVCDAFVGLDNKLYKMHGTYINICLLGVNFSYDKSVYFRWMMCNMYRPHEKQNDRINGK